MCPFVHKFFGLKYGIWKFRARIPHRVAESFYPNQGLQGIYFLRLCDCKQQII